MRIKRDFILKSVAGENVVVPTGERVVDFTAMISLNETAAFLWTVLQNDDVDENGLIQRLTDEYIIDEEKARMDVRGFIKKLKEAELLDD